MKKTTTLLALLLGSVFAGQAKDTMPLQPPSAKTLHFTENKGQVTDQHLQSRTDIDFKLAAGNGLNIFIGKGKLAYQWAKRVNEQSDFGHVQELSNDDKEEQDTYALYRMDVELIGANTQAKVIKEGLQSGYERYFQPWVNLTNSNHGVPVLNYNKLTYQNIYPHIDWIFYFNDKGQLEHDFVVRPGGNVSDIKIRYRGAQQLQVNADGSLSATTALGSIKENAPIAYEQKGKPVPVSFVLNKDILSFATAAYKGTLIIDPIVEWGSYFGGTATDAGMDITTDKWGNVYLCGSTNSVANIATVGAHQVTFAGAANDAFLSKWNSDGALLWSTHYGGTNVDIARGVACDTLGNVYMGGNTNSVDGIGTTGAFQDTLMFGNDAFLVKFDTAGTRLWGSYFGGSSNDAQTSFAMCVDANNHVYLSGNTQSTNLATTVGVHQPNHAGNQDAFVSKWSAAGNLVWCTYYGGSSADLPYGITTDSLNHMYLVGYTQSTGGMITPLAYQTTIGGGQDAFIAKFDQNGQRLWGSYYGGVAMDRAYVVKARFNKVYIAGITQSPTQIATPNAHQTNFAGGIGSDGFITVLDGDGALQWSTYYGGEHAETVEGIGIANNGEVFISGQTQSTTGVASTGSYKDTLSGAASDLFLAKFDPTGLRLWGSYYGGVELEQYGKMALFQHKVYIAGLTESATAVATPNAAQSVFSGGRDACIIAFNDCPTPSIIGPIAGDIEVCNGAMELYTLPQQNDITSYSWLLPQGWQGNSDSNNITVTVQNNSGMLQVVAFNVCGGTSDTQSLMINVLPLPAPVIVANGFVLSTTQAFTSYQWLRNSNEILGATQATHIAVADGGYSVKVGNEQGCTGISNTLIVTGTVAVKELEDKQVCRIYPNPVKDKLWVELAMVGSLDIWALDGRMIQRRIPLSSGTNEITVKDLAAGPYLLYITTDTGKQVIKMVKQ